MPTLPGSSGERRVLDVAGSAAQRTVVSAFEHGRRELYRRCFEPPDPRAGRRRGNRGRRRGRAAWQDRLGDGQLSASGIGLGLNAPRTRTTAHHRPSARPMASKPRSSHFKQATFWSWL